MRMPVKDTIHAKGIEIGIYTADFENEFISLTDIARYKSDNPSDTIRNWMRGRDTLEFLGLWERLHNPGFKPVDFDAFRSQAGTNALERLVLLRELAVSQMWTLTALNVSSLPRLTDGEKE